jgi:hypothetical protein
VAARDETARASRMTPIAAAALQKANAPARQSGSRHPPKSSAVAATPAAAAVSKAATASALGTPLGGTNLAMIQAAPPAMIQRPRPMGRG